MMKYLKAIFEQTLLITFGILVAISLEGLFEHIYESREIFSWYMPGSAIIGGLGCAIPSVLLLRDIYEQPKRIAVVRIVIHFIALFALNSYIGYLFKWFTNPTGYMFVALSFVVVYVFTWIGSYLLNKQEDKEINDALKDIRDEE